MMEKKLFSTCLNDYMERYHCSAAKLAEHSGLSASLISRYLRGLRKPAAGSEQLARIAEGLARASRDAGASESPLVIRRMLSSTLTGLNIPYAVFLDNLRSLIEALSISNVSLAKALNYDPSYVSRLLRDERHPADLPALIEESAAWIALHYDQAEDIARLSPLLEMPVERLGDANDRQQAILAFLSSHEIADTAPAVQEFLDVVDSFDFDAFARQIGYDKLKIPNVPFTRHNAKVYTGIEEMKTADIDWIKATVLGHSTEDVILFSDMPIAQMGEDEAFVKKYSFGLAAAIKKGMTLHMIHDVHRPMNEMLLGLKSYIPMYMTGQIKPYYFPSPTGTAFHHILKVSGSAALEGTVIHGHQKSGRYYMTRKPGELSFYKAKARHMLSQARPLMRIYKQHEEHKLKAYLDDPAHQRGELFTMDYGHSHILLRRGQFALVSKEKSPTIHFVIELPQMVRAFEALFR